MSERDRLIALADRLERSTSRGNFNEVVMAAQAAAKALRESAAALSQPHASEQGAAPEPVAQVSEVEGKRCVTFYSTKALHETPLWTKLYTHAAITSESAEQVKGVEDAATELAKFSRTDFIRGVQWAASAQEAAPTNPFVHQGSLEEAWRKGFEGRPNLSYPNSEYSRAYARGKRAAKSPVHNAPAPVPPVSAGLIDDELASWSAASDENRQAVRIFADGLRKRIAQQAAEPDMRAVCEALGFDPTNHHNAAKCPYCRHAAPVQAAPTEPDILAGLRRIAKHADDDGTAAIHIEFLDRVIDEIEDMGKAYALLFAENAKLRAAVDAATPAPVAAPAPVPPLTDEQIENIARAFYSFVREEDSFTWDEHQEAVRIDYRAEVRFIAERVLAAASPTVEQAMDEAVAAGDGTLHGAIDYWQERALKAEAALGEQEKATEGADEEDLLKWTLQTLGFDPEQPPNWKRLEAKLFSLGAPKAVLQKLLDQKCFRCECGVSEEVFDEARALIAWGEDA